MRFLGFAELSIYLTHHLQCIHVCDSRLVARSEGMAVEQVRSMIDLMKPHWYNSSRDWVL